MSTQRSEKIRLAAVRGRTVNARRPAVEALEEAEAAFYRVEPEALALRDSELTPLNVDVVVATSTILRVAPAILAYRPTMAALPRFEIRHVDGLVDRARAAWFAAVTQHPEADADDLEPLLDECSAIRQVLLLWAVPLVHIQRFERTAVEAITPGTNGRDVARDLVTLAAVYRERWPLVRDICGVTQRELQRAAALGAAVFAALGRRERGRKDGLDASQRVRRCWSLADRAYDQCQRAIAFFEWGNTDLSTIAPSLRRNRGLPRASRTTLAAVTAPSTIPPQTGGGS